MLKIYNFICKYCPHYSNFLAPPTEVSDAKEQPTSLAIKRGPNLKIEMSGNQTNKNSLSIIFFSFLVLSSIYMCL